MSAQGRSTTAEHGEWLVRHAGKESGPFDVDRLRTLARRGAITRFHQLSLDGREWINATDVRAIFNADGSVASGGRGPAEAEVPFGLEGEAAESRESGRASAAGADTAHTAAQAAAHATGWGAPPQMATVRVAQVAALALATLSLAAPTHRSSQGAFEWWISGNALEIAVYALCSVAVLVWWIAAYLPPSPSLGSALAAVSTVLAVAAVLPLYSWAAWAIPASVMLPLAVLVVACQSRKAPQTRAVASAVLVVAPIGMIGSALLLWTNFRPWGAGATGALVVASAALVVGAIRSMNGTSAFVPVVVACACAGAALFCAAFDGLQGAAPMQGARGAVAAVLAISLSVLAWSGAHQALTEPTSPHSNP